MMTKEKEREQAAGCGCAEQRAGAESEMSEKELKLARVCKNCPMCRYGRSKPESLVGRVMNWHGQYCPAWKAYEKLEKTGQGA